MLKLYDITNAEGVVLDNSVWLPDDSTYTIGPKPPDRYQVVNAEGAIVHVLWLPPGTTYTIAQREEQPPQPMGGGMSPQGGGGPGSTED